MNPVAGWYADPNSPNQQRYWDGRSWTEHVQRLPPPVVPQPPAWVKTSKADLPPPPVPATPKKRERAKKGDLPPPPVIPTGRDAAESQAGASSKQGCLVFFVVGVLALGLLGALVDTFTNDQVAVGGTGSTTTTQSPELFADLEEEISDDSDRVDAVRMDGSTLVIETFMRFPVFRGGPAGFSDEVRDIAQDVSKSEIQFETLEIAVRSELQDGERSVEGEVLRARWSRQTVDSQDWSEDPERFLLNSSDSVDISEPGFSSGELQIASAVSPTTTAEQAPTTSQAPATTEQERGMCVLSGSSIPIDRSCFVNWPLTVESGDLRCVDFDVFFVSPDGERFAVNGNARGSDDFSDIFDIVTDDPTERSEIQSFINFAASIPGCEIGGLGEHVVPGAAQTTTSAPAFAGSRLGEITGASACTDDEADIAISTLYPEAGIVPPSYLDLRAVELTVTDLILQVSWTMGSDIPSTIGQAGVATVEFGSWSVLLWSNDRAALPADEELRALILAVDFSSTGISAVHEGFGSESFDYLGGSGNYELSGNTMIATFDIESLGEIPSSFEWTAATQGSVLADPSDPNIFSIADDNACGSFGNGGTQFPG